MLSHFSTKRFANAYSIALFWPIFTIFALTLFRAEDGAFLASIFVLACFAWIAHSVIKEIHLPRVQITTVSLIALLSVSMTTSVMWDFNDINGTNSLAIKLLRFGYFAYGLELTIGPAWYSYLPEMDTSKDVVLGETMVMTGLCIAIAKFSKRIAKPLDALKSAGLFAVAYYFGLVLFFWIFG